MSLLVYMVIYFLSSYFVAVGIKYKRNFLMIIGGGILILFAAIRSDVGTDFQNYLYLYHSRGQMNFAEASSKFMVDSSVMVFLIAKISNLLGSQAFYFGIFATISVVLVIISLNKEYNNVSIFLAFFIYLCNEYTTGLNIMKQIAAVSIIFYGCKYIFHRDIKRYCIAILMAMAFHMTAIIALPLYLAYNDNIKKDKRIKLGLIVLYIFVGLNYSFFLNILGGRFSTYLEYEGNVGNKSFGITVAYMIFFCLMRKRLEKLDKRNSLFIFMYGLGMLLELIGFVSPYVKRIAIYYTFPKFILLAQIPRLFVKSNRLFIFWGIISFNVLLFIILYVVLGQALIYPYQTIFSGGF